MPTSFGSVAKGLLQLDGFTGKKMQNNMLDNVCQKRLKIGQAILLRICIQIDPKIRIHGFNDPSKNLY
jgi:hypothetical protein